MLFDLRKRHLAVHDIDMFRFELCNSKAVFNILNKFETWFLKAEASFLVLVLYFQSFLEHKVGMDSATVQRGVVLPKRVSLQIATIFCLDGWTGSIGRHGGVVKIRMFFTNKLPGRKYSG